MAKNYKILDQYYWQKWNALGFVEQSDGKNFHKYSIKMSHSEFGEVELALEYERSHPEYGIYYGCIMKPCNEDLKRIIWDDYKACVYPNNPRITMDDVFLPDCEKADWLFWIRVNEDSLAEDVKRQFELLKSIFYNNGFREV